MNGKMIGTKPLYVALAQRKDVRRQALESQMAQRSAQRLQYGPGPGMMNPYYPQMQPYGQPGMMPMRVPPMMYPGGPQMMQARPRYAGNQPGMPMPMGYPGQMGGYPGGVPQNYNVRPGMASRPPTVGPTGARLNGGPSPVGMPQGLPAGAVPRGQMPIRQQQAQPEQAPIQQGLNAQTLAKASPTEQKQALGEALYPLIHE